MRTHVLAVSMGDPAGIGPELVLKVAADSTLAGLARLAIVGGEKVLRQHAAILGVPFELPVVPTEDLTSGKVSGPVVVDVDTPGVEGVELGRPSAAGGQASVAYVERALELVHSGAADALVTGPINKVAFGLAGLPWAGHTDFLKERTRTDAVVMMLVGGGLRVGLVTHHIPISEVPSRLSVEGILSAIRIMAADLERYFGCVKPHIAVAGLNPHASDGGRFGDEEARIIRPAIEAARTEGINCDGPHPPDTLFVPARRERYDAVLAMYHDQGLIPLKMQAFGRAVNVTLGLPIVRTSVDHGTAYDIAGKGVASTDSLVEAIRLAVSIMERLKT